MVSSRGSGVCAPRLSVVRAGRSRWPAPCRTLAGRSPEGIRPPRTDSLLLDSAYLFYIVYLMARAYLGEFEHLVILALLRLGDRAYGVTVRQEIELRAGREVSIGAIYATLERLQRKGYVRSALGEPTRERGGRSKRFFRVTGKGRSEERRVGK